MNQWISTCLLLACWCFAGVPSVAGAADGDDGLYERFDGDVWVSVMAGAGARLEDSGVRPLGALELRARYLDSAGLFVTADYGAPRVSVAVGVDLRPLFLARFLT